MDNRPLDWRAQELAAKAKAMGHQPWICRNPQHKHDKCEGVAKGTAVPVKDCICHSCNQYHRTHVKRPRWKEW